jgi:hypothetical protein
MSIIIDTEICRYRDIIRNYSIPDVILNTQK